MISPERKEAIRQKAEAAIVDMEAKIAQLERETAPIGPENAIGRISRMDAINNKSVAEAALRTARKRLGKLKLSIASLDKPNFGLCNRCKGPIQEARLLFMPESDRCVRCADR